MTALSKTFVPQFILDDLEPIKDDDQAVKDYGIRLAVQMCNKMREAGQRGFHFYCLNLERSTRLILEGLDFVAPRENVKPLPWNPVCFLYLHYFVMHCLFHVYIDFCVHDDSLWVKIEKRRLFVPSFGVTVPRVTLCVLMDGTSFLMVAGEILVLLVSKPCTIGCIYFFP